MGPVRGRRADLLVIAALCLVAVFPVAREIVRPQTQTLTAAAAMRLGAARQTNRALRAGRVPVWDPYQAGGRPHLADPDTLALYPPSVLIGFVPSLLFFPATLAFHACILGVGAYAMARRLELSRLSGMLAAFGLMLGAVFSPLEAGSSSSFYAAAWLPLVLASAMRSCRRARRVPHPGLVLCLIAVLLTASPRGVAYAVAAAMAVYAFALAWPLSGTARPRQLVTQAALLLPLILALTAFVSVPAARLLRTAGAGSLVRDAWQGGVRMSRGPALEGSLRAALAPLRGHRTLGACDARLDERRLLDVPVPVVGGVGGLVPVDYVRYVNLATGSYPERPTTFGSFRGAGRRPGRADLMRLLDVEYLVSCDPVDATQWSRVVQQGDIGIYTHPATFGRAVWTCSPRAVSRDEIEYWLSRYQYDATLSLLPRAVVHIRWGRAVREAARRNAETALRVVRERQMDPETWQYELLDTSRDNIGAIVASPLVEDTAGLDRGRLTLMPLPRPNFSDAQTTEWLIGRDRCTDTAAALVRVKDRWSGRVVAEVEAPRDGLLFFSEAYYRRRAAWVDGQRVTPLKVNLAFTGVPVSRGRHRVELAYDPDGLLFGAAISAFTMIGWIGCEARASRSRARSATPLAAGQQSARSA